MKREINPRLSYKKNTIHTLSALSRAVDIQKKFIDMPRTLKEQIDHKCGDIPRSKYISRILELQLDHENSEVNQQNV